MTFWANYFSFNDISCEEFELMLYSIGNNDNEQSEMAGVVTIAEESLARKWKPFFYGTSINNKLTFNIVFGVNEERLDNNNYLSRTEIDDIATWLTGHDKYKYLEIHQDDLENVRFKCMITSLRVVNYGRIPWALEATVTCDGPFAYRYPKEYVYTVDGAMQIKFENPSCLNGYYYPDIEFSFSNASNGEFSIENQTDSSRVLSFSGLPASIHTVRVNNDTCVISNDQDINIYGCCNYKWLRLKRGMNILNVTGNGTLKIKCEFPMNVGG